MGVVWVCKAILTIPCLYLALGGKVVPFNLPDVGEAIQTVEVKEW